MKISKNNLPVQNTSFKGHKVSLDKKGGVEHSFYYLYDKNKYNCALELYQLDVDDKFNYSVVDSSIESIPMDKGVVTRQIDEMTGFAYRFKLTELDANGNEIKGKVSYAFDNGAVIGIFDNDPSNKYNVVLANRATINKNGPMQLIMPDGYNPEKLNAALRAKTINPVTRTHANKFGGNLDGIIARLDDIEKEGIVRIVGTPFTKDSISSHKYWTENAFRVAPDFGKEKSFEELQVELFKHGINWVSDAALVNEGFGGIHVNELLRHGKKSFAQNMFNISGTVKLGVLPAQTDYARIKFVNAPFVLDAENKLTFDNPKYDEKKPTYIQFYDQRLASKAQIEQDSTFDTYDNKTTKNIFEITKHDDAVYPYSFEVSPTELSEKVKGAQNADGKLLVGDLNTIKEICDFGNFKIVSKGESGGIETWDGNVDIPKLNFFTDDKEKQKGALAVRDYAITSGKYWTQLTSNLQLKYLSKVLANKSDKLDENMIGSLIEEKEIPARTKDVVDNEVIDNVLNGEYHSRLLNDADKYVKFDENGIALTNQYSLSDYITKKAMDVPLETMPVASNLLSILTSPYIAKKPNAEDEIGVSRFELNYNQNLNLPEEYSDVYNRMDSFYIEALTPKINEILSNVTDIADAQGDVSDYGKYVISEIVNDLTKYLIVKSLAPDADIKVDDEGNFDFSNLKEDDITMQSLGIPYDGLSLDKGVKTPLEQEAKKVMTALETGINNVIIDDALKAKINNRFKDRTLNDFKMAEMILDRTESGLGWRIDATKDIVSISDVRAKHANMQDAWDNVISFWKGYNEIVLQENPHAYTTAEITDLYDLFKGATSDSKYISDADAERKFIEQTGITSVANYNYFFSKLPSLFAPVLFDFDENAWESRKEMNKELSEKMVKGWDVNPGFLFQSPADGVINSYTFVGNHDKPRVLHLLAVDQTYDKFGFFRQETISEKDNDDTRENKEFINNSVAKNKQRVAEILGKNVSDIDFYQIDTLAAASADRLFTAVEEVGVGDKNNFNIVKQSIAKLLQGKKTDSETKQQISFDPKAFGTKSFELIIKEVFDEAELNGANFENRKELEAKILESILVPAFDRMKSIYKLMMVLPGSPTDFAGDKVGSTGFETKAKNYHQQNRNPINWEWLKKDEDDKKNPYSFVREYNKQMQQIAQLRQRPELSALNDGDTIVSNLGGIDSSKTQAFIRYNDK